MEYEYPDAADPLSPNSAHAITLQLTGSAKKVLELGAYGGHVTKALKNAGNHVVAVELDGRMREKLEEIADEVIITDLEWLDLGARMPGRKFDVVIAGDVLEHCRHPDLVMLQIRRLLEPGGSAIISLPNVAHGDVRLALLAGKFEYGDAGLLDRTHLRFFTRSTIEEFLVRNGMQATEWFSTFLPLGGVREMPRLDPRIPREALDYVATDRDSVIYQYVVRAVPTVQAGAPDTTRHDAAIDGSAEMLARIALLQSLADERAKQIMMLESSVRAIETNARTLEHDNSLLARQSDDLARRLAESETVAAERLAKVRDNHRRQLERIHSTRTWRWAGRLARLRTFLLRRPRHDADR